MSIFKTNGAPPSLGIARDIAKAMARIESLEKQLTTAWADHHRALEQRRRAHIEGTEQGAISEIEEGVRRTHSVVDGLDDALIYIRQEVMQLEERLQVAREKEEREQKATAIETQIAEIEALRRDLAKGAALMAKAASRLVKAIPSEAQVEPVNANGDPALLVARAFVVEAIAAAWPDAVEYWELLSGDAMVMVGRKLIGEELVNTPGRAQEQRVPLISHALIALLTRKVESLRTPQARPRAVA
jgi:predicted RNase H-like nuclease (RuvC/YqgF family)